MLCKTVYADLVVLQTLGFIYVCFHYTEAESDRLSILLSNLGPVITNAPLSYQTTDQYNHPGCHYTVPFVLVIYKRTRLS